MRVLINIFLLLSFSVQLYAQNEIAIRYTDQNTPDYLLEIIVTFNDHSGGISSISSRYLTPNRINNAIVYESRNELNVVVDGEIFTVSTTYDIGRDDERQYTQKYTFIAGAWQWIDKPELQFYAGPYGNTDRTFVIRYNGVEEHRISFDPLNFYVDFINVNIHAQYFMGTDGYLSHLPYYIEDTLPLLRNGNIFTVDLPADEFGNRDVKIIVGDDYVAPLNDSIRLFNFMVSSGFLDTPTIPFFCGMFALEYAE